MLSLIFIDNTHMDISWGIVQVMEGVVILCAGVIFQKKEKVRVKRLDTL